MTQRLRIGVVLAGGGTRAAYQVGVIRALASLPVDVVAVSAVGAGALNGAILASSENPASAARTLGELWNETVLAEESAVRLGPLPVIRLGTYLTLLFAGGVSPEIEERLRSASSGARGAWASGRIGGANPNADLAVQALSLMIDQLNVSTDAELDAYLSTAFRSAASQPRIPFFVSVYETGGHILETVKHGLQLIGMLETGAPRYLEISNPDMRADDRTAAVLASASLPFVCKAGTVGHQQFIDGSFAGMKRAPGAVPLQPFRRHASELRLDAVVVVHTEGGVSWDATQFGDIDIIEVRPSAGSQEMGIGYFWPNKSQLASWIALGERDAAEKLNAALAELKGWRDSRKAHQALLDAASGLDD
jgi:predicted acylesterase/phospholipase RssA